MKDLSDPSGFSRSLFGNANDKTTFTCDVNDKKNYTIHIKRCCGTPVDISDHFPIVHINCSFSVEETVSCLVTRVYNERNKQKFLQAISDVDCNIPNTQSRPFIFMFK